MKNCTKHFWREKARAPVNFCPFRNHGRIQRGGQGVRTPPPPPGPWNCQIINFCHVEIFRQTPSGNLDPPAKMFWIRACVTVCSAYARIYTVLISLSNRFAHVKSIDGYIMKNMPMQYKEIFFKKQKVQVSLILYIYIFSLKTYIVGTC